MVIKTSKKTISTQDNKYLAFSIDYGRMGNENYLKIATINSSDEVESTVLMNSYEVAELIEGLAGHLPEI